LSSSSVLHPLLSPSLLSSPESSPPHSDFFSPGLMVTAPCDHDSHQTKLDCLRAFAWALPLFTFHFSFFGPLGREIFCSSPPYPPRRPSSLRILLDYCFFLILPFFRILVFTGSPLAPLLRFLSTFTDCPPSPFFLAARTSLRCFQYLPCFRFLDVFLF